MTLVRKNILQSVHKILRCTVQLKIPVPSIVSCISVSSEIQYINVGSQCLSCNCGSYSNYWNLEYGIFFSYSAYREIIYIDLQQANKFHSVYRGKKTNSLQSHANSILTQEIVLHTLMELLVLIAHMIINDNFTFVSAIKWWRKLMFSPSLSSSNSSTLFTCVKCRCISIITNFIHFFPGNQTAK